MHRRLRLAALALATAGIAWSWQESAAPAATQSTDNVAPPGFIALFNGLDLAGWKGLVHDPPTRAKMPPEELAALQATADEFMRAHWRAENGVLAYDGQGANLCTVRDFEDFELWIDWKIDAGGDSGIYVRGSPQVQIWDRPEGSGGLYNNQIYPALPLIRADKPVGEWNRFRILMIGERVTAYLNDRLVVDNVLLENYWERDKPIYAAGSIELQQHGNPLYFKNIYLREIPRRTQPPVDSRNVLQKLSRVALCGDSITEQRLYSLFVEDYLRVCLPHLMLSVTQLGWSGERVPGFLARMDNDLLPYHPTVVTTAYGMNDGSYQAFTPEIGDNYRKGMLELVQRLKAQGCIVVVGSPGAVDFDAFKMLSPAIYNDNLSHLRDIAREVAEQEGMPFANVFDHMILVQHKAKAALGAAYDVCGADGFHPRQNGHLVMAYAFLKGLGVDGAIGTFSLDLKGVATATDGHSVVSWSEGKVEIESTRYPFCVFGDPASPEATRSIVSFLPFHEELNRLLLKVTNMETPAAEVEWGSDRKTFKREQLERGVNLAAEFPDNPFCVQFRKVDELVARKQAFETRMIKDVVTHFPGHLALLNGDLEAKASFTLLHARFLNRLQQLEEELRAAVIPLRHALVIRPLAQSP